MKYDIITIGSAVIDAFVETGISELNKKMCYDVGTKIAVKDLKFATGGGGTNTAVSFSKLGLKTAYVGKLGKDCNAQIILGELKKEGIEFLGALGAQPTGFSVILDSTQHHRTILTYRGVNDSLKFSELPLNKLNAKWFYFSSMTGLSHKTQEKLAEWTFKRGIKIAFNPSSYITNKGAKYLANILKKVYVLILNDEEARDLVPEENLFKGLHTLGPKIVCITYGEKGAMVSDGKNIFQVQPNKIKVAELTGAGDAFASGFVAGLIKLKDVEVFDKPRTLVRGTLRASKSPNKLLTLVRSETQELFDIVKAAQIGTLNAESVIQIPGAKNGLISWKEALDGLKKGKVKVFKKSDYLA